MSDYQTLNALKPVLMEIESAGDFDFSDLKGKKVVIYFYPKDNTPGCTCEGEDFRDAYKNFLQENTIILGVSRDSVKSHEKFKINMNFRSPY